MKRRSQFGIVGQRKIGHEPRDFIRAGHVGDDSGPVRRIDGETKHRSHVVHMFRGVESAIRHGPSLVWSGISQQPACHSHEAAAEPG